MTLLDDFDFAELEKDLSLAPTAGAKPSYDFMIPTILHRPAQDMRDLEAVCKDHDRTSSNIMKELVLEMKEDPNSYSPSHVKP